MKLLLTSNGLSNASIAKALFELVGKPASETKLAFIPTAANVEVGDKGWLADDLARMKAQGLKSLDIVDISAIPREMWEPRLRAADVIFVGGGNVYHLMYWMQKSGFKALAQELLATRIYAGISAGSMVAGPRTTLARSEALRYDDWKGKYADEECLGLVDFQVSPHLNSSDFPDARTEALRELTKDIPETVYALDDRSAVKVVDMEAAGGEPRRTIEIISEGKWEKFN